jgi:hypothetical protein
MREAAENTLIIMSRFRITVQVFPTSILALPWREGDGGDFLQHQEIFRDLTTPTPALPHQGGGRTTPIGPDDFCIFSEAQKNPPDTLSWRGIFF